MSGLMNAGVPPGGGVPEPASDGEYAPCAQLDEYVDSAELIARSDPIADASLPDMRARSRPGTAIAAMIPMIATTISSSMRVKPAELRMYFFINSISLPKTNGFRCIGIATRASEVPDSESTERYVKNQQRAGAFVTKDPTISGRWPFIVSSALTTIG